MTLATSGSAFVNKYPIKQKFKSQVNCYLCSFMRTVPVPIITLDPYSPKNSTDFFLWSPYPEYLSV